MDCATGAVAQRMEYDAFGNELTLDSVLNGGGSSIREVPFRFSTKYTDAETNLSYYGYRYYSAEMGRWFNRDPIAEQGGVNLYGMVGNGAVNQLDVLGLDPAVVWQAPPCPKGQHKEYIQHMVGYERYLVPQPDQFDGGKPPLNPFYPGLEPSAPFQDTPSGFNGKIKFELCRACVCDKTGKIISVGPCVNWTESDGNKGNYLDSSSTDLGLLPSSRHTSSPSIQFKILLSKDYPEVLGPALSCMCEPGREYPKP